MKRKSIKFCLKSNKISEKEIQNSILHYLATRKDVFCWQNDSVGIYDPVKKCYRISFNRYKIKGVSDILGIADTGQMIAIEVKSKIGRLSEEQALFLKKIQDMGGIACVARSIEDVKEALSELEINRPIYYNAQLT